LFGARDLPLHKNPTPTGVAEIVGDDFQITSRPEGAMLGLDFAPANSARNGSESGACSWGTVTQTEQNRECSASPFFYGNGGTKFRKSEILSSAQWAALLIIQDHLGFRFAQFELCAHFLQARSKRFNLLLLPCDVRFQFLNFAVLFEEFV
jgi:hypothetical protein